MQYLNINDKQLTDGKYSIQYINEQLRWKIHKTFSSSAGY